MNSAADKRSNQGRIRPCTSVDRTAMLEIINQAAEAYRGVIPDDRWHEPYMPIDELASEIAAGVEFSGYFDDRTLAGVMGVQSKSNVDLIRHAYVHPDWQGRGVGRALISRLVESSHRPMLVGTWRAAIWAVRFYEANGFILLPEEAAARLLRTYWAVPERQIETSVVLAHADLSNGVVMELTTKAAEAANLARAC